MSGSGDELDQYLKLLKFKAAQVMDLFESTNTPYLVGMDTLQSVLVMVWALQDYSQEDVRKETEGMFSTFVKNKEKMIEELKKNLSG